MTYKKLKTIISECCNDVIFNYNGLQSGIASEVRDGKPVFYAWHGESTKEYTSVDALMTDKFFSGRSALELIYLVDFTFA